MKRTVYEVTRVGGYFTTPFYAGNLRNGRKLSLVTTDYAEKCAIEMHNLGLKKGLIIGLISTGLGVAAVWAIKKLIKD